MKNLPTSKLTKNQKITFNKRIDYDGINADIIVTVRYDDDCGNGHNSFSITGDIYKAGKRSDRAYIAGGCVHDEIAKHFPELRSLIKWHLCSSDGPMHYISNTTYHARDTDTDGKKAGEPIAFKVFRCYLNNRLAARLPSLMADFKSAVLSLGLEY